MPTRDPYTILGVPKSADAAAIKKAFRAKARAAHPDSNPDDPKAEDRFKEVNRAYEILGDAEKRARFDRGEIDADGNEKAAAFTGARHGRAYSAHGGGARGFSFEDIFGDNEAFSDMLRGGNMGGGRGGFQTRGANVSYTLRVGFVDAVAGTTKRVALTNGKTLDVRIPPGTESGQTLRLKSQGMPGANGGAAGDALIEIQVQDHPHFSRQGNDILLNLPVTLKEAVLGAKVPVPTPHGTVTLSVPKGSSSGKVLRLRGKGVPGKTAGDLLVTLMVALPENDPALAAFAEAWTPADPTDPRKDLG
ncbi:DnaJ C-terminal domain-containing protein [Oleispirillum naphthae]|uniref:DnaJ C-terminal domain-containing protein n=1 Tax=Oleispirillum naphthae TaxID=2838853 RepID=UPI00308233D7